MNKFQKHFKLEMNKEFDSQKLNSEDLRKIGEAVLNGLVAAFDDHLLTLHKLKTPNPNMTALKKALNDLTAFGQAAMQKFGNIFEEKP